MTDVERAQAIEAELYPDADALEREQRLPVPKGIEYLRRAVYERWASEASQP